ncbi:hypothetical protein BH10ACT7_BH10ACT7_19750 [soil metagenome]
MTVESERAADARSALARCISVPEPEFADDYWGKQPLLSRAAGDFSDLFSLDAVDELVANRAIRTPFVRMANEGTLLANSRYTGSAGFGAEVGDQLDSDKVLAEFAGGATLVLQGLHRTWAPLREFTRRLIDELGHPAQVNAYVTPASSRGFDPHYDVHDGFLIQIHGQKHWVIHPPVHQDPLRDQPWSDHADAVAAQAAGEPAIDATFSPGDVLYLPRGWIHSATALGGTSIHLTIGVEAFTQWDVVQQLVKSLADDPALRSSLPVRSVGRDPEAFTAFVMQASELMRERLLSRENDEAITEHLAAALRRSTRPEPLRPISTVDELDAITGDSTVRWRAGMASRVDSTRDVVKIVLDSKTVTLPGEARSAIEALADGHPVAAGSLVDLDTASSLVVARRLVREGILVLR